MIPLKLQLKNFLSYGSDLQTIDFSPYQLICLSGKNGHGKSALLDAMTWALWGQARKVSGTAKADQGLLNLGQTQMLVVFDFILNNQTYRIRREFALTYGKPYANLEFGLLKPETDSLIPLTDKTIRATQTKIEQTLHLDFESFSNSAFLRQGESNEFSKKPPKERKQVLATILGLDQYETIRKLAMEKTKQATIEKKTLLSLYDSFLQDLQTKESLEKEFILICNKLDEHTKHETNNQKEKINLNQEYEKLRNKQKQLEVTSYAYKQFCDREEKKREELKNTLQTWRSIHKKHLQLPDIKQLDIEKKELVGKINIFQKQLQKGLELKENYLKIKEQLQQIALKHSNEQAGNIQQAVAGFERLNADKKNEETNLKELSKQSIQLQEESKKISHEIEQLSKEIKSYDLINTNAVEIEKQFEKRKAHYQKWAAQGNWVSSELKSLEQKKKLVHDESNPSCPLCEQNLSASRKRFLKNKFSENKLTLTRQFSRLSKYIEQLKIILFDQHKALEKSRLQLQEKTTFKATITELQKTREKIKNLFEQNQQIIHEKEKKIIKLSVALQQEKIKLETLKKQTHKSLEITPEYKKLYDHKITIETQARTINYDAQEHKKTQSSLEKIDQHIALHAQIREQLTMQNERKNQITDTCIALKKIRLEKHELEKKLLSFEQLKHDELRLQRQEKELSDIVQTITKEKETLFEQRAHLQAQRTKLDQIQAKLKEQSKHIKKLQETIDDYQSIATATSKDGIQALLIEDAIPEIEQEANELLAKLTNNQAHIIIESLRDLKKGGTKETLEIKISDAAGIRPYELFSGGEAFRIDFALRIAISKLLARRAGTALQTLIIDEGFGSQDEEGLTYIMDAIYKILDDFSKIIIVSHLPAMKDQFPVHFVVQKGPHGSHVSVIEQG